MEDIAPALLEQIRQKFTAAMAADQKLKGLFQAIQSGAATYADAGEYAGLVGQLLSSAIESVLTLDALPDGKLYYNIAEKIFQPMLEEDHRISSQAAAMVQKALNKKAGIGLQAQTAAISQDRIDGILEYACAADPAEMKLSPVLDNFSRNTVDETLKANADFHSNVGFSPVIVRRMVGGGCKWCRSLVGTYDYPDKAPKDIFRRHENCRCTVEYDPGTGKRQNTLTKQWTDSSQLEERKNFSNGIDNMQISDNLSGKKAFHTTNDPARDAMGSAEESNPKEIAELERHIKSLGVELERPDNEKLDYEPGLFPGQPGRVIISKGASYSAWCHEVKHVDDDASDGWPGFRIFADTEKCKKREYDAYQVEIDLARSLGHDEVVAKLEALRDEELKRFDT